MKITVIFSTYNKNGWKKESCEKLSFDSLNDAYFHIYSMKDKKDESKTYFFNLFNEYGFFEDSVSF